MFEIVYKCKIIAKPYFFGLKDRWCIMNELNDFEEV